MRIKYTIVKMGGNRWESANDEKQKLLLSKKIVKTTKGMNWMMQRGIMEKEEKKLWN